MNITPKVIVSNPVRMHTHQLCVGLAQKKMLDTFYTTVWYCPGSPAHRFLCALPFAGKRIRHILLKRYEEKLSCEKIATYPLFEVFRQIKCALPFLQPTEDWFLSAAKKFDRYVSRQIKGKDYDVFIGYEVSCLSSMKTARQDGKITVLDLAQVHWKCIEYLRNRYSVFESMQKERLFRKVSALKEDELQYVDHIITLSTFARDTLIGNGIRPDRVHTVNLGFDPAKFRCKETYRTNPDQPLRILFAGTVTRRKGIHLVLEAAKHLPDVQLTIVGPVSDGMEYLKRYRGYYTYYPFLHHGELAEQYREADLFLFPSYLDSWAMVVLEAMASGTPVVVTENTGAKDAVAKGGGKIIPVDDLEALKSAIGYYHADRSRLQKDGLTAHKVAQDYTWANYHNRISNIISNIIQQHIPTL